MILVEHNCFLFTTSQTGLPLGKCTYSLSCDCFVRSEYFVRIHVLLDISVLWAFSVFLHALMSRFLEFLGSNELSSVDSFCSLKQVRLNTFFAEQQFFF